MNTIELERSIQERIKTYEEKLLSIEHSKNGELVKKLTDRDQRLLDFLYKEYSVYQFAVLEFKKVLNKKEKNEKSKSL